MIMLLQDHLIQSLTPNAVATQYRRYETGSGDLKMALLSGLTRGPRPIPVERANGINESRTSVARLWTARPREQRKCHRHVRELQSSWRMCGVSLKRVGPSDACAQIFR
jgi:hypothetical protein